MPELVGALDPEEAGPAAPSQGTVSLRQALLAHHALGALAVHLAPELAACERGDHARAVGRVGLRDFDDRLLDGPDRRPASLGVRWIACRLILAMRATVATGLPAATSSRDRATRSLSPHPAKFPRYAELVGLAPEGALSNQPPPSGRCRSW